MIFDFSSHSLFSLLQNVVPFSPQNDRVISNQAAHPNMRTYYFCTDTGKEMELWMKAMIDAALVQTEPVKR